MSAKAEEARAKIVRLFQECEADGLTIGGHWTGTLVIFDPEDASADVIVGVGDEYDGWREE